ncbi:MAG TPA: glutamate 5-kinase [Desulfotomaculum sp.]|nr:MAG: Glutamate 5-kinase [Desulfotomaculum sp. 46_80]HAG11797.1 glutamate 5-kinase [Desulfotomaculum sp.]HBY03837.1 glutamate 5-kinase [Desulfotomaculum sp.]
MESRDLSPLKRVVVKIGSSSLIGKDGALNISQVESLADQIAGIKREGVEVLLVSSGAIGLGIQRLGFARRPKSIPEKQACASVGQGMLINSYEKVFAQYSIAVGQVLLTREDFSDRKRFLNARNTMSALLRMGALPVINENDTVAVDEIPLRLGDNDNLAALVSVLVDADLLILLSDIDGLYTGDPRFSSSKLISEIKEITEEIEKIASGSRSALGTGGMITKLQAARITMHSGITMVLAAAGEKEVIRRVLSGETLGTIFWPLSRLANRRRWIAYNSTVQGRIFVDDGAAAALLHKGKSLLPSGIRRVEGNFKIGNTVSVIEPGGREIARGIVNYSSEDIEMIKGTKTWERARTSGRKAYDEVIHRNNLVMNV